MALFRTPLQLEKATFRLTHQDNILSIGSCFAQNIGAHLEKMKFQTSQNPYGILYNPISIAKNLERLLEQKPCAPTDFFEHQGLWHHFDFHSQFSAPNLDKARTNMNTAIVEGHRFLKKTTCLILTLGTAHVFVEKKTDAIVANCHKLPPQNFARKRLDITIIKKQLADILQRLKMEYPALNILLTVSPIRHIRDGLVENQRSKACLLLAVAALVEEFAYVHYFPAYELVLDELRDYRFYEEDMIHPNKVAIDFIWQKFSESYFNASTLALFKKIKAIQTASQHRPFNSDSAPHQLFLQKQIEKTTQLEKEHPFLDFVKERALFTASFTLS